MQISDLAGWVRGLDEPSAAPLLATLRDTLDSFVDIGLGYLSLDRPAGTLSGGEAQRTKLIRHLGSSLTDVTYVFDEPTVGLDPIEAARLRGTLAELKNRGKTIILTSHNLTDVEELADRVILIHSGRIKYDLPLARFKELAGYRYRITATLQHPTAEPEFENHPNVDGTVRVTRLITSDEQTLITRILEQLQSLSLIHI